MGFDRVAARLKRLSRSIIFKLLALALLMVALGFVGRFILLRTILTEDVGALSAAHQLSIAEYAARDVEDKVRLRLELLTNLAASLPIQALAGPHRLSAWLSERHAALPFFSHGLHLVQVSDGAVLATSRPDRPPLPVAGSDWFKAVPVTGAAHIGKPYRQDDDGKVVLTMAVPVRDQAGVITAILTGTSAINSPNFLYQLAEKKVGETGGFLLIDPRDGVFIAATDPERVLKPLPPPGLNPLHDRAMAGFRGSGITTNVKGVEEMSAIASVPTPGWFLVARVPTAEAFKPVDHIMSLVIRGGVVVSVSVITILLIMLPHLFRPLTQAARQLHHMARGEQEISPLPVHSEDEVGEVAKGFNFLLGVLREKEEALRQSEARMTHQAYHDMLTGLPNRTMFEDRLDQALMRAQRQGQGFALLYIDLDGFKPINDSNGHQAGDAMLRHVADCLTGQLRQTDTVARIGGDEFTVLLTDLDDPAPTAARIAQQCRTIASQPLIVDGTELSVDLSIGIACYPQDGRSAGELLRHADHAMYQVKGQHKSIA
ncbi:MAG: hypothetical protein FD176_1620 [Rhodospirillaceae bacterium]|nr:MAG: hypothetical protein FD176_1620 [Rhodospirillaceae bacterium]TNC95641.1 MAG: hypothetical protein FD119_2269 [Stygiobacter sp.]